MQSSSSDGRRKGALRRFPPKRAALGTPARPISVKDVLEDVSPPLLRTGFELPITIRYQKTSATIASVYWRALCNLLIVSIGTTSGYVIYNDFRPKRVVVYGLATSASGATGYQTPVTRLTMYGTPTSDLTNAQPLIIQRREVEDVSTNDVGCRIGMDFPLNKQRYDVYANCTLTNSPVAFTVEGPIGTIVDLKITINLFGNIRTTLPKTSTTSGATSQVPYFNLLDNTNQTGAAGSSFLTPISCAPANVNGAVWL